MTNREPNQFGITVNDERFFNSKGEEYLKEVGSRIHEVRKKRKMTLVELGNKLGLAHTTISRYERGLIGQVDIARISDIADILNTTSSYLLGYSNIMEKEEFDARYDTLRTAHHLLDSEEWSIEELHQIMDYISFVYSKRLK